jgi:hypothetical protein
MLFPLALEPHNLHPLLNPGIGMVIPLVSQGLPNLVREGELPHPCISCGKPFWSCFAFPTAEPLIMAKCPEVPQQQFVSIQGARGITQVQYLRGLFP